MSVDRTAANDMVRRTRQMGVYDLQRSRVGKRWRPNQSVKQENTGGVEVGSRIDWMTDAAGLLGRDIAKVTTQPCRPAVARRNFRHLVGKGKIRDPRRAGAQIAPDAVRGYIVMHDSACVQRFEEAGEADADLEHRRDVE